MGRMRDWDPWGHFDEKDLDLIWGALPYVAGAYLPNPLFTGGLGSSPDQIRTGVTGLRGRRPWPLDDGTRLWVGRADPLLGGKDSNPQ